MLSTRLGLKVLPMLGSEEALNLYPLLLGWNYGPMLLEPAPLSLFQSRESLG